MTILSAEKIQNVIRKIPFFAVFSLIVTISFLPTVLHQKYHIFIHLLLILLLGLTLFIKKRRLLAKEDVPLFLFIGCTAVNIFFAPDFFIALKAYLNLIIPLLSIYYFITVGMDFNKEVSNIGKTFCVVSIIIGAVGIVEYLFGMNIIYQYLLPDEMFNHYIGRFGRPLSTQGNPAVLGTYMVAALSFHLGMWATQKEGWRRVGQAGVFMCITIIFLTFSRGVFLSVFAFFCFYWLLRRNFIPLIIFFLSIVLLITLCSFLPGNCSRYGVAGFLENSRMGLFSDYRIERCVMTGRMLRDNPVAGVGLNHFRIRFNDYYKGEVNYPFEFMIADNMYLTIAAETGVAGFLSFSILIFSVLKKARKTVLVLPQSSPERITLIALLSGFLGILVNMSAYELFYWPNQYALFCIMLACIEGFNLSIQHKRGSDGCISHNSMKI